MPKRRPAPPAIQLPLVPDPTLVNRRAKAPPTLRAQWIAAMADVTAAKNQLVDALLVLQGVQVDYTHWADVHPSMFKKSKAGKRLDQIVGLVLTVDVRHLTAAAKLTPP